MIPTSHNPIPAVVAGIAVYLAAWFLLVALAVLYAPEWVAWAVFGALLVVTAWLGYRMTTRGER